MSNAVRYALASDVSDHVDGPLGRAVAVFTREAAGLSNLGRAIVCDLAEVGSISDSQRGLLFVYGTSEEEVARCILGGPLFHVVTVTPTKPRKDGAILAAAARVERSGRRVTHLTIKKRGQASAVDARPGGQIELVDDIAQPVRHSPGAPNVWSKRERVPPARAAARPSAAPVAPSVPRKVEPVADAPAPSVPRAVEPEPQPAPAVEQEVELAPAVEVEPVAEPVAVPVAVPVAEPVPAPEPATED